MLMKPIEDLKKFQKHMKFFPMVCILLSSFIKCKRAYRHGNWQCHLVDKLMRYILVAMCINQTWVYFKSIRGNPRLCEYLRIRTLFSFITKGNSVQYFSFLRSRVWAVHWWVSGLLVYVSNEFFGLTMQRL